MRSSIAGMIQSVLEFRFMHAKHTLVLTGDGSYISGKISVLPFSAKNAYVKAYLSWITPNTRLKNVVCCFQTISCLLSLKRETNGSPQLLVYFLPYGKECVHPKQCVHPKHFRVSGIKISNVVTKETSQILLQTLWHLRKPQINLVSLWRDSFTDVGYSICQVERLPGYINRCHRLFWTGLLLTPTVAT